MIRQLDYKRLTHIFPKELSENIVDYNDGQNISPQRYSCYNNVLKWEIHHLPKLHLTSLNDCGNITDVTESGVRTLKQQTSYDFPHCPGGRPFSHWSSYCYSDQCQSSRLFKSPSLSCCFPLCSLGWTISWVHYWVMDWVTPIQQHGLCRSFEITSWSSIFPSVWQACTRLHWHHWFQSFQ